MPPVLNEKVQLAIVVTVIGAGISSVLGWGTWSTMALLTIQKDSASQSHELAMLRVSFEEKMMDRFTLSAASEAALRQAIENPGYRVPDPRDPSKVIVVREGTSRP